MAFIAPNGQVFDPEGDSRRMIMEAIAQRRDSAARERASARNAMLQQQALATDLAGQAADRAQQDRLSEAEQRLAREQLTTEERMATAADASMERRIKEQREYEEAQQVKAVDEEERMAADWAHRLNRQLADLNAMRPDPAKDIDGSQTLRWQQARMGILSRLPSNLELGLIEEGGRFRVNPDHYRMRRAPYIKTKPETQAQPVPRREVSSISPQEFIRRWGVPAPRSMFPPVSVAPRGMSRIPSAVPQAQTAPQVPQDSVTLRRIAPRLVSVAPAMPGMSILSASASPSSTASFVPDYPQMDMGMPMTTDAGPMFVPPIPRAVPQVIPQAVPRAAFSPWMSPAIPPLRRPSIVQPPMPSRLHGRFSVIGVQ